MIAFFLSWLLLLTLVLGCSPASTSETTVARDSSGVTIVDNRTAAVAASCALDSVPILRIGGAAEEQDALYSVTGATRLSDGRVAVVSSSANEVRWYDRSGRLLQRTGRTGRGPGEFANALYLARTRGDTIWVGDFSPWQWQRYGPDYGFLGTVRLDPAEANPPELSVLLEDGQQFLARSEVGEKPGFAMDSITVRRFRHDGALAGDFARIPSGRYGQTIPDPSSAWVRPWFEADPLIAGAGQTLAVATWDAPEFVVYAVADSITLARIVRWTTADRSVRQVDIDRARAAVAQRAKEGSVAAARFMAPEIDPTRPAAERFPALDRLMVAQNGWVWVREYPAADSRLDPWLGFTPEGRLACRVHFPRMTVFEIGRDYLLASQLDSLGFEAVTEYRLNVPHP